MTKCRALVSLSRVGGLPEDVITNTWHFEDDSGFSSDGGIGVNGPGLISRLKTFYEGVFPLILAPNLTGGGVIRLYNMADPKPRIPRLEGVIAAAPPAGSRSPGEVACCLSFSGAKEAGAVMARRRGRVFLGPIRSDAWVANPSGSDLSLSATTMINVLTKAKTMAAGGSGAFRLAVFSPTTAAGDDTADAAWSDVTEISMDNALDTVRSRGAKRTQVIRVFMEGTAPPVEKAL